MNGATLLISVLRKSRDRNWDNQPYLFLVFRLVLRRHVFRLVMAAPLLESVTMELVLSKNDAIDLLGWEHAEELVVIALQDLLQLYLLTVALLDSLLEGSLIGRLALTRLLHLIINLALLLLHLPVEREEPLGFLGRELCLLRDILLHIGLELLG